MSWGYPKYVSVGEKKAKAQKKLQQLKNKNPNIQPVVIEGNAIAKTWWGKSWNQNLEKYADYSNRIGRGRSYVRNGMVLNLEIHPGEVIAMVQGTASQPYNISIQIRELKNDVWESIKESCLGRLDSLPELLEGKFPKDISEILTAKGAGLFPSPDEIKFSCSCPDWAYMCKHVAAALYGIGARLDNNPSLFFTLRKINMNELISSAVEDKTQKLLKKASNKSARIIDSTNLSDVFGIELDDSSPSNTIPDVVSKKPTRKSGKTAKPSPAQEVPVIQKKVKSIRNKKTENQIAKKKINDTRLPEKTKNPEKSKQITTKSHKPESAKKCTEISDKMKSVRAKKPIQPSETKNTNKPVKKVFSYEQVFEIIRNSRKGISLKKLMEQTGYDEQKIYNICYRLKKLGWIQSTDNGLYKKTR